MIARSATIILMLGAVAAVAFEVGRQSEVLEKPKPKALAAVSANESAPAASAQHHPLDVVDIAHLPFADAYAGLKQASPEELAAWLQKLEAIKPSPKRWSAISSFFKTLIQIDAGTATKLIAHLGETNRFAAMMTVKDAAPPRELGQVVDLLRTFPILEISSCSSDYLRDAFAQWSAFDPVAASGYLDQHPDDENLSRYVATIVENWASYDPDAARKWAERGLNQADAGDAGEEWPYRQAELTKAWVNGYLRHDRAGGLDYIISLQDRPGAKEAIPEVAEALFRDSPTEARAFLQRLPEERQAEALRGISWAAERKVYADADAWKRSPEFVANWMLQFPDAAWSDPIEQVITEWRYGNAQGLFAWMSQLPDGTREKVAAKYQPYLLPNSAAKEFDLVLQVSDISLRDRLLENVMTNAKDAKPAILQALEDSPLPENQKQNLAGLIPQREYEIQEPTDDEEDESDSQ